MNTQQNRVIKSGEITIDMLGEMINNGFKESRKELLEVKAELIESIDTVKDDLTKRIDTVKSELKSDIKDLGTQIGSIRSNYATVDEHNLLGLRVKKLERRSLLKH